MKVGFVSLGCSKNLVDSEQIMGMFGPQVEITDQYDQAEVIFINTCGFIEIAKREAIDVILEMAEYKSTGCCQRLVVLGCLAQRYAKELREDIPEIDLVVPLSDYAKLNEIADKTAAYGVAREATVDPASSPERRAAAIAVVAKSGSRSDFAWLASFLVNQPEPVKQAALDAMRHLDARLRQQDAPLVTNDGAPISR